MPYSAAPLPVAIIGAGPAGLMAAEVLSAAGVAVAVYDAMPSVGRKFLLAGVGGMNITHAEPYAAFASRYYEQAPWVDQWLQGFNATGVRHWVRGLGLDTFVGSSGRVFPTGMKAAPLLRAWLKRLREQGVAIHTRHHWQGWDEHGHLRMASAQGEHRVAAHATLLALGGASWPRLGSDGAWQGALAERGVALAPLRAANCGFEVQGWSALLREKFAGSPLKTIAMAVEGQPLQPGEAILTETGLEGSLVYALSAAVRQRIEHHGHAWVQIDLLPQRSLANIQAALEKPRGARSMAKHLYGQLKLDGAKAALLRELASQTSFDSPAQLAHAIKALRCQLVRTRPLAEAISSAGGVRRDALTDGLMLKALPGVFCAGEMLDWEAPTGGYLLTACLASGRQAAGGMLDYLAQPGQP
ncbi:TIGR03862 family flavoprotein [Pseudomonas typographi]|uniref:TIGR03862 family flavoprotein n=1 Tax=Pseudomonas typographi TaxID=2715964 RepID=A0ABR7Z6F3_9PSED|nr:TIGR03862 family flavoprotein [Pseudomonas typographi]MBD1553515.1 TIGR03862 family flavoprotein [Pseudomonas typographi]MBD1588948.1 TIGR03862 family flavoprotein [Pseudomonas typographi]MBD1600989.1 TIGR03862 family flavoprotein [Pseudomonas typographi]